MFFKRNPAAEFWREQAEKLARKQQEPCPTCATLKEEVAYLREELKIAREERRAERDEFKRAMDRLLAKEGHAPVGQGPSPDPKVASPRDVMGLFNLEVEDGPHGPEIRKLSERELMG